MWQCYDKIETPKILSAFLIERLPKEEITKLSFVCPKCKEQLSFINKYAKSNTTVRSHFAHKSNSNCNWLPEGESEKHYNLKFSLLDELTNDSIKIQIGNLIFDTKTNDYNIIFADKEIKEIVERRADIILRLKNPNALFGLGIAIEVMVSEQIDSIKSKARDYALRGYSLATTQDGITIEVHQVYPKVLSEIFKDNMERFKQQEEIIKQIDSSFLVRAIKNKWDCTTCSRASKSTKHDGFIACFKDYDYKTKTGHVEQKADIVPCSKYYPSSKPPIRLTDFEDIQVKCKRGDEE